MDASAHHRYRYIILSMFACLVPVAIFGAIQALQTNENDVRAWLPEGLPETNQYAEFSRAFGSEEFVTVSWQGCTLDDPRVTLLAESLGRPTIEGGELRVDDAVLVASVIAGPQALAELMEPPIQLSREQAMGRLRGLLIGPDGRQTCVVVRPSEHGKRNPLKLLERIRQATAEVAIPADSLRMGGPPVMSTSIDRAAAQSLAVPGPLSVLLALLFSWLCFRSLRMTVPVIAVGVFSAVAALAVVWFTGATVNAVLLSMPPLVYVATTSGAIHWANYYREEAADRGLSGAPSRAAGQALLPLTLATATTSMGLLSLCASELLPIRHFGFYAAIGVGASLLWLLLVLPAWFALAPAHPAARGPARGWPAFSWWRLGDWIARQSGAITWSCLAMAGLSAGGLWRVETTVSAEEFFRDDAELPRTSRWLEQHLGGMVPMELMVRFGRDCDLNMLERMEVVERIQARLATLENVGASVSAATFSPAAPQRESGWSVRRSVFNRRLERNRDRIVASGFLAIDGEDELWRISLRTRSFHHVDQRYFIHSIRQTVEPLLQAERDARAGEISATYTGLVPLINRAQNSLLNGLCLGLLTDLVLIVVTIVVLMRHWSAGVVMCVACVLPAVVVLGTMGWLGVTLDMGTVLAPSVAIGVSVDDVLHFVLWFRRGLQQGLDRREAVRLAYRHCGRAMFQSWGVIGLGLGVLALSDFTPTQRFGLLMLLLVSVGLFVNLVLLPALLVGPLGKKLATGLASRGHGPRPSALHAVVARAG